MFIEWKFRLLTRQEEAGRGKVYQLVRCSRGVRSIFSAVHRLRKVKSGRALLYRLTRSEHHLDTIDRFSAFKVISSSYTSRRPIASVISGFHLIVSSETSCDLSPYSNHGTTMMVILPSRQVWLSLPFRAPPMICHRRATAYVASMGRER